MAHFQRTRAYTREQYDDVAEASWYGLDQHGVVADAYEYRLMQGVGTRLFSPDGQVTLAEALTMAARVHSIYQTGTESFATSVPWFQVYVDYTIAHGIIGSDAFTDYSRPATRAELAYVFVNALPETAFVAQNTVNSLPDVTAGTPYASSILRLYRAGVLTGSDTAGTFYPARQISRAETAAIVSRVAQQTKRVSGRIYGE